MIRTSDPGRPLRSVAMLVLAVCVAQCSVSDQTAPSLTGPSERALSLTVTATPDQLPRDGVSQSIVTVTVRDPQGNPVVGQGLTVGVSPSAAVPSESSLRTDASGRATVAVTALPPSALGNEIRVSLLPVGVNAVNASVRSVSIFVLGPGNTTVPTPAFTTLPAKPTVVDTVTFDASPTTDEGGPYGNACTYAWAFGDGTTGLGQIVRHLYASAGAYTVTLTVTDLAGTSASTSTVLVVAAVPPPTVSFTASPTSPTAGQNVTFTATAQPAPDYFIRTYSWSWGDGSTPNDTSSPTIVKVFDGAGTFAVTVTATDDLGQTGSATQTVVVQNPLTASFTFSPTDPTTADTVRFDASGSTSSTGTTIVSYAWNFGDGDAATTKIATNTFPTASTFVVRLTITDSQGNTGTVTQTVTVKTP